MVLLFQQTRLNLTMRRVDGGKHVPFCLVTGRSHVVGHNSSSSSSSRLSAANRATERGGLIRSEHPNIVSLGRVNEVNGLRRSNGVYSAQPPQDLDARRIRYDEANMI
uniref:Uncharacterized protein n=1 Tax=Plectus sambesii TaxID=2011161 RepID=A0A914VAS3_9BILA